MVTSIDAGNGYRIVSWYSVTLNGLYYRGMSINEGEPLALLTPDGKAVMNGDGDRPWQYKSVAEAMQSAAADFAARPRTKEVVVDVRFKVTVPADLYPGHVLLAMDVKRVDVMKPGRNGSGWFPVAGAKVHGYETTRVELDGDTDEG